MSNLKIKQPKNKKVLQNVFNIIALIMSIFMLAQLVLTITGQVPLCTTSECSVIETYIILSPSILFGIAFLWFGGIRISRFSTKVYIRDLFYFFFIPGVAFEGVLLGYAIRNNIPCQTCVAVGISLALLMLLDGFIGGRLRNMTPLVWLVAIAGSLVLTTPATVSRTVNIQSSSAFVISDQLNDTNTPEYHLYIQFSCAHCTRLLESLGSTKLPPGRWSIHIPGKTTMETAQRIKLSEYSRSQRSLMPILQAKKSIKELLPSISPSELKGYSGKGLKSLEELADLGFEGVPALVVLGNDTRAFISGDAEILRYISRR